MWGHGRKTVCPLLLERLPWTFGFMFAVLLALNGCCCAAEVHLVADREYITPTSGKSMLAVARWPVIVVKCVHVIVLTQPNEFRAPGKALADPTVTFAMNLNDLNQPLELNQVYITFISTSVQAEKAGTR